MSKKPGSTPPPRKPKGKDKAREEPLKPAKMTRQPKSGPRVDPTDPVEEASWESFPASDPPSFNPAPRKRDEGSG